MLFLHSLLVPLIGIFTTNVKNNLNFLSELMHLNLLYVYDNMNNILYGFYFSFYSIYIILLSCILILLSLTILLSLSNIVSSLTSSALLLSKTIIKNRGILYLDLRFYIILVIIIIWLINIFYYQSTYILYNFFENLYYQSNIFDNFELYFLQDGGLSGFNYRFELDSLGGDIYYSSDGRSSYWDTVLGKSSSIPITPDSPIPTTPDSPIPIPSKPILHISLYRINGINFFLTSNLDWNVPTLLTNRAGMTCTVNGELRYGILIPFAPGPGQGNYPVNEPFHLPIIADSFSSLEKQFKILHRGDPLSCAFSCIKLMVDTTKVVVPM